MQIRPSSALRNEYTQISELAKASGEPIFITNKGEDDGVYMSMAAYEEREKMFRHRDKIYAAQISMTLVGTTATTIGCHVFRTPRKEKMLLSA